MKAKLNLAGSGGVQSRRLGDDMAFYDGSRPFGKIRLGNQITITPPAPARGFEHPWKTSVRWYDKGQGLKNFEGEEIEGFGAIVNPGLVSGLDPVAIGAWSDDPSIADVPSQGIYSKAPGLLDQPIVPLPARAFGIVTDKMINQGLPQVKLPVGLREIGVDYKNEDFSFSGNAASGNINIQQNAEQAEGTLYAGVVRLYLRAARPAVAAGENVQTGGFFQGTQYLNGYDMQNLAKWGNRAQLLVGWIPDNPPPMSPLDALAGAKPTDLGYDFINIAEIFVVSPEEPRKDERGNMIVDGGWIPYVRHLCFWNLEYRFDPKLLGDPIQLGGATSFASILGTLAGGAGLFAVATQAALESAYNKALAVNASVETINKAKGVFFT